MWAVFGEIEFELFNHPTLFEERTSADYAEHALVQGKPRLEFVGEALDELHLELQLHAALVDTEVQIRRFKTAKAAREPLPLVLGSGDYRGVYLITNVDTRVTRTDGQGRVIAAGVSISLREYTGAYNKPLPRPRALASADATLPGVRLGGVSAVIATPSQRLLASATAAGNLLRASVDAFNMAKTLRNNPTAMLGQASDLVRLTQRALEPLDGMQGVAQLLANGADLVQLGASTSSDVRAAVSGLSGANLANIVAQVDDAANRVQQASARIKNAAPRLAGLAALIITRRA